MRTGRPLKQKGKGWSGGLLVLCCDLEKCLSLEKVSFIRLATAYSPTQLPVQYHRRLRA